MSVTDELEKKGIKIDTLSPEEQQTYFTMLNAVAEAQLTPEKLRDYIISMKGAVEDELTKPNLDLQADLFLKARLKNYMLLESFLISPQKAKIAFEKAIAGLGGK